MNTMKNLIYRHIPTECRPPMWMAYAVYRIEYRRTLYVIYPLNYLITLLFWLQDKWCEHVHEPSWIDQEVDRRVDELIKARDRRASNRKNSIYGRGGMLG